MVHLTKLLSSSSSSSHFLSSYMLRFTLLVLFVSFKAKALLKLPPNVSVPAVFVFGDSVVDTGNNNNRTTSFARSNFPPYGRDFEGGIPTGRFSNGKVPSDLIGNYHFIYTLSFSLIFCYIYFIHCSRFFLICWVYTCNLSMIILGRYICIFMMKSTFPCKALKWQTIYISDFMRSNNVQL